MSRDVRAASDALISRAMPGIKQKIANLRDSRVDRKNWCIVVGSCDVENAAGLAFYGQFSRQVPVGPGHVFCALIQTPDVVHALATSGCPPQLGQQLERASATVPENAATLLCSVTEGITALHLPFREEDLPPPEPGSKLIDIPVIGRKRLGLLQSHLPTIHHCYAQMVAEGLDASQCSVLLVDANGNAMGVSLIERVEADAAFAAKFKADAAHGKAEPYFNYATNEQLAPAMTELKIEVDGVVKEAAIGAPVRPGLLRVVVCTQNGASSFDIPRPVQLAGPEVPQA
jgi:hypothetical protein